MGRIKKLTKETELIIVEEARAGVPSAILAEKYKISRPTLNKVLIANNISREPGRPEFNKLYYTNPEITLTEESYNELLAKLTLQGLGSEYLLIKKTGMKSEHARSFMKNRVIPIEVLEDLLKKTHIYAVLVQADK